MEPGKVVGSLERSHFSLWKAAACRADTIGTGGLSILAPFERHIFVCQNLRPEGAPRPSCTSDGKSELFTQLQNFAKAANLGGRIRINKAGCLDQCEHGPTVVVYPDAVWYGAVQGADAEEIVTEHLVGGRPVERLRLDDACVNTKSCVHRG